VLASDVFSVLELTVWFALGCYWTVDDRQKGEAVIASEEKEAEGRLGFGQLVPICLLLLPLFQLLGSYASLSQRGNKRSSFGKRTYLMPLYPLPAVCTSAIMRERRRHTWRN